MAESAAWAVIKSLNVLSTQLKYRYCVSFVVTGNLKSCFHCKVKLYKLSSPGFELAFMITKKKFQLNIIKQLALHCDSDTGVLLMLVVVTLCICISVSQDVLLPVPGASSSSSSPVPRCHSLEASEGQPKRGREQTNQNQLLLLLQEQPEDLPYE